MRGDDPRSKWLSAVSLTASSGGWAVGNADSFDSRPGNIAEHWDGSGWQRAATPRVGTYGFLSGAAALSATDAWAVGSRDGATLVERWDGERWRVADSAPQFNAYLLSVSASGASDVWAVGASSATFTEYLEHWDGSTWTSARGAGPQGSGLTDVEAQAPNNVWASGYRGNVGAYLPLVEHWNGTTWSLSGPKPGVFPADSNVNGVSSLSAKDAWVAGSSTDSSRVNHPLIGHWDGNKWQVTPSPDLNGVLTEVKAISADDVWVAGKTGRKTLVEHWDGTAWTKVASPSAGVESMLLGLDATASDDVVAVGGYLTASGARRALTLHWDGTSWTRS